MLYFMAISIFDIIKLNITINWNFKEKNG